MNKPANTAIILQPGRQTFACRQCGQQFDKSQALHFTISITVDQPTHHNVFEQAEVCGKRCLINALNNAADKVHGIVRLYGYNKGENITTRGEAN